MHIIDFHHASRALHDAGQARARPVQGLAAEVDQLEGQPLRVRARFQETLHFDGRAAAHVEHLVHAPRRPRRGRLLRQEFRQDIDAVAVRRGDGGLQKGRIDDLKIRAGALARVVQQLVDHLVVARVAQRFCKRAEDEGCAQDQRMQGRLGECPVGRRPLFLDERGFRLELAQVQLGLLHQRQGQLVEDVRAQAAIFLRQRIRQVDLLDPARHFRQKGAHFVDDDLVVAADAEALAPAGDKGAGLFRHGALDHHHVAQLAPLVDQGDGNDGGQARVDAADDDGLAHIGVLRPHAHRHVIEHLADLHNRVGIVDFHDQRIALQVENRAAHRLTLGVAETDDWIDLRL